MATAIGTSLFYTRPLLVSFGGGSGLVCGALTCPAVSGARTRDPMGFICRMTLVVLFIETGYELYTGETWLANRDVNGFVVMTQSHVAGCLSAVFWRLARMSVASIRIKRTARAAPVCRCKRWPSDLRPRQALPDTHKRYRGA